MAASNDEEEERLIQLAIQRSLETQYNHGPVKRRAGSPSPDQPQNLKKAQIASGSRPSPQAASSANSNARATGRWSSDSEAQPRFADSLVSSAALPTVDPCPDNQRPVAYFSSVSRWRPTCYANQWTNYRSVCCLPA